jgi:hypothetical protein
MVPSMVPSNLGTPRIEAPQVRQNQTATPKQVNVNALLGMIGRIPSGPRDEGYCGASGCG